MATDWTGIALVVSAVLTPLSVAFLAWLNNKNSKKVIGQAEDTHQVVLAVDAAVNGKAPGETTLSEDVTTIMEKQELDLPSGDSESPMVEGGNGRLALVPMIRYLTKTTEELKATIESQQQKKKVASKSARR